MNAQSALFYENFSQALDDVIKHAGGSKVVGHMLWPELPMERVGNKLKDCLNENRPEKLSPDQVILILKLGRDVNCHAAIHYLTRESGYSDPQPIQPEDEKARLQREFIDATKHISALTSQLQTLGLLKSVA